jgi:transposase-like protein
LVLEQAYERLKPYSKQPVNINLTRNRQELLEAKAAGTMFCPHCGSPRLTKQGFKIAAKCRRQRYQCQACGGWCCGKSESLAIAA